MDRGQATATRRAHRPQARSWLDLSRRQLLVSGSAVALSACWPQPPSPSPPGGGRALVDVHCHLFNASDLSAEKFIRITFFRLYDDDSLGPIFQMLRDAFVDEIVELFMALIGASRAPTAAQEIAVLTGAMPSDPDHQDPAMADAAMVRGLQLYLTRQPRLLLAPGGGGGVRGAVLRAGGVNPGERFAPLAAPDAQRIAARAYTSDTVIGRYLRWFSMFTLYRSTLADRLQRLHADQQFTPHLLCPAMVDYAHWLENEEPDSPLRDQVEVMSLVGRRLNGPLVHGYVAFDPLRQALYRPGGADPEPMGIVRDAIGQFGFLGVKLYPPMGFRASGNPDDPAQYQPSVAAALGAEPGKQLNDALCALYQWCEDEEVSILAHAQDSNAAGDGFGMRADPVYWAPVVSRHRRLRLCLAHFGGFDSFADQSAPHSGDPAKEQTWEWAFGQLVQNNPGAPIYRDVSYLHEVWKDDQQHRRDRADKFMAFIKAFDPKCEHLMFGTDWIMLASEQQVATYSEDVLKFFKSDCKLDDASIDNIFIQNALRFLGLTAAGKARARLEAYYNKYNLPFSRVPIAAS